MKDDCSVEPQSSIKLAAFITNATSVHTRLRTHTEMHSFPISVVYTLLLLVHSLVFIPFVAAFKLSP